MTIAGFDITAIREAIRIVQVLKDMGQYKRDQEGDQLTAAAKAVYVRITQLTCLDGFVDAGFKIAEEAIQNAEVIAAAAVHARQTSLRGMGAK
jgi:hypothetical protein